MSALHARDLLVANEAALIKSIANGRKLTVAGSLRYLAYE
jgi:hypothetical protein